MTDPGEPNDTVDTDDNDDAPPPELKDPGKAAIERMKARVKEANGRAAAAKAEADQIRAAAASIDPDAIEARVRAQVATEVMADRALDKVEVSAATMNVDPDIARAMLVARVGEFVKDGKVDQGAIKSALEALIEEKPYLASRAGRRFAGSADSGARPPADAPADMNQIIRRAAGHS